MAAMPSFMKKALAAATTAKDKLEDYRAQQDAASIAPVDETPEAHDVAALTGALRRGAVDPRPLLTHEEAADAVGQAVGSPQLTYSDQSLGVRYEARDRRGRSWAAGVTTWYLEDGGAVDEVWEMLRPTRDEGEPVADLGREAHWDGQRLYVLTDAVVFHVEVEIPDEGSTRGRARLAAQDALARL
jgi:hypothetical protein